MNIVLITINNLASCSGVIVGDNTILTARHCIDMTLKCRTPIISDLYKNMIFVCLNHLD